MRAATRASAARWRPRVSRSPTRRRMLRKRCFARELLKGVLIVYRDPVKRASLYSSSRKGPPERPVPEVVQKKDKTPRFRAWLRAHRANLLLALPGIAALAIVLVQVANPHKPESLVQEDIDAAVTKSLEVVPIPSMATRAYEAVRGSVVRVR